MPLPTKLITLKRSTRSAIIPGLEFLGDRLAEAKLGHLPHRHPLYHDDLQQPNGYQGQEYNEEMAALVLSTRDKLHAIGTSSKIRLNVFELSASALALRIGRQEQLIQGSSAKPVRLKELEAHLETYRKRARNAAANAIGTEDFKKEVERWQAFVKWIRVNLCQVRKPQYRRAPTKTETICAMMAKAITDRGRAPVADEKISYLAKRVIDALHHGRIPGWSVDGVISDPKRGEELLYKYALDQIGDEFEVVDDRKVPELCIAQSHRAAKFRKAMVVAEVPTAGV
ncbi:MAG TPA: hypothetical protein VII23_08025 [Terriglobales bacterium]